LYDIVTFESNLISARWDDHRVLATSLGF